MRNQTLCPLFAQILLCLVFGLLSIPIPTSADPCPQYTYVQNLMRSKSKRLAGKGLKLACFVAECLGTCPDSMAASSFSWAPEDEGVGRAFRAGTDVAVSDKVSHKYCLVVAFLQDGDSTADA